MKNKHHNNSFTNNIVSETKIISDDKLDKNIASNEVIVDSSSQTPMMQQYYAIKKQYPDCILFFRMGDFYEMFDEDANIASSILSIVLTKRHTLEKSISMCGIPYHSYENYLNRLIKAGFKVAICEQTESPLDAKKRGYKAVVNREVLRIVTASTAIEEGLLDSDSYNYLLSIFIKNNKCYIAWLDISSAKFIIHNIAIAEINNWLYKINPKEIVIMDGFDVSMISQDFLPIIFSINKIYQNQHLNFVINNFDNDLSKIYADKYHYLDDLTKEEKQNIYLLLSYVLFVYKQSDFQIIPLRNSYNQVLHMDSFTYKSLELLKNNMGGKAGSLRSAIDYTLTNFGSRMLSSWIEYPLLDIDAINQRLDCVEFLKNNHDINDKIREVLKNIPDIQRGVSRILMHKGVPKDLFLIRKSLDYLIQLKSLLQQIKLPSLLSSLLLNMNECSGLYEMLNDYLSNEEELYKKNPNYLNYNCDSQLQFFQDQQQVLLNNIESLQQTYVVRHGISNLKIIANALVGYYIEVPLKQVANMKQDATLLHRQTLSNVARYSSEELEALNNSLNENKANVLNLENIILNKLYDKVVEYKEMVLKSIDTLGWIDILQSFAYLAQIANLSKPLIDNSKSFIIKGGRHLVVEDRLKKMTTASKASNSGNTFISNDCAMDNGNIFLITGPNMSGKSTFLRQNALIIVLAQMGCFVPAKFAHIGIVDAIYSRVGASDDLFKGQSTFMVEMLELSIILNSATERSFLILDEIGRGTSTYDGLSISWATLEYINNKIKARTLFATHYHELVELERTLNNVVCYCVKVSEHDSDIVFLYEIIKGFVSKSYGIQVAKLAGLPKIIIDSSYKILAKLETKQKKQAVTLDLFSNVSELYNHYEHSADEVKLHNKNTNKEMQSSTCYDEIIQNINNLNMDNMSPKDALNFLYDMKDTLKKNQVT